MWKSWKRRALAENKTDYSKYRFSWQEYLLCFFKAFFATGAFTYTRISHQPAARLDAVVQHQKLRL